MSNLLDILKTSAVAVAKRGDVTVKIERTNDMNGAMMGYWYDVRGLQGPGSRTHTFYFDYDIDVPGMEWDLQELGIDTSVLVWQATDQGIDLSKCTCDDCNAFLLANGMMPRGAKWYERLRYRVRWAWSDLKWQIYLCWLTLRYWCMRWHR